MSEPELFWLDAKQLLEGHSPFRSRSVLYRAIRDGVWPKPEHVYGRSLWRSDEVRAANERISAQVKAVPEERAQATAGRAARLAYSRRKPK